MQNKPLHSPRVIRFMTWRTVSSTFSVLFVLISIISLLSNGLNLGMEFTGGQSFEFRYAHAINIENVRTELRQAGIDNINIVEAGSEREIRVLSPPLSEAEASALVATSLRAGGRGELVRSEKVGPQIASELRDQSVYAILVSLVLLLAYVSYRFQIKFAIGAISALAHDVVIVLGFFSLMHWNFSLNVFAAVLTVIGYSLNDTIVVFDRIRENLLLLNGINAESVIDISLTQTLERTLMTSSTTLVVVLALYIFGGDALAGFSLALIIGLVVGTYSSIYIASNIVLGLNISRQDMLKPVPEEEY